MNDRILDLHLKAFNQAQDWCLKNGFTVPPTPIMISEIFSKLLVQECADFVRQSLDHEAAESIAFAMEVRYGVHGDYA